MFKYVAQIEMKNSGKFKRFGFIESKPKYVDCVAVARDCHTDYPEAKSVAVSFYNDGKEVCKREFKYSELTEKQIGEINDWVGEIDIDESELESARYNSNIYGVEAQYAVGGYDYDEDEYWNCQLATALTYLDGDMAYEYFDFARSEDDDEAEEQRIHNAVRDVILQELNGYEVL